ncbi:hypothetical protein DdX_02538 [Ditylenchus destructor]|uniref:Uncharacterized protein n=1 Tax=Ditylenchus destructor TaxID=166010 RepID=A0AAD4NCX5_9BILA|nr:hypothetical protein DdX_02538 [Ditylenchus destructor]
MSFASVSPSICGTVVGNSGEEQGTTAPNNVPLTNTFGQRESSVSLHKHTSIMSSYGSVVYMEVERKSLFQMPLAAAFNNILKQFAQPSDKKVNATFLQKPFLRKEEVCKWSRYSIIPKADDLKKPHASTLLDMSKSLVKTSDDTSVVDKSGEGFRMPVKDFIISFGCSVLDLVASTASVIAVGCTAIWRYIKNRNAAKYQPLDNDQLDG